MPITTIGSYVPTMRDFRLHWTDVNAAGSTVPLILPGNYTLADFTGDENAVVAALSNVTSQSEAARVAANQLALLKEPMRERVTQFRLTTELNLSATRFKGRAPRVPDDTSIESKFMAPLDEVAGLWASINAATDLAPFAPPLTLPGAYALAAYQADVTALRAAFAAAQSAERTATDSRADRDALLGPIYERMKQYRTAVVLYLPKGSPLLATVPRLTPPPGTTPPPLVVSGAWDATITKARLTWTATTDPTVNKIQVRACTGGTYRVGEEEIVADLAADAIAYDTEWGLTTPGAVATFKVYVMTTTGNENGGKAVKIVRPTT